MKRRASSILAAASAALATAGSAQVVDPGPSATPPPLKSSRDLAPPPSGDAARRLPIVLRAREMHGRPDLEAVAEGDVEFRRGGLTIRADQLSYDSPEDLARAVGHVRVRRDGAVYSGPELQLRVERFEGWFAQPEYEFLRLHAGGRADRVDFIDSARSVAVNALYTSCPRDGSGDPDWVLQAKRVHMDFDANEGVAEGAVLRFLGLPILAAPRLSFPLTDARKSGWLPPSITLDNRSGLQVAVPYYWDIAPNRDATLTPRVVTRRGLGLDTEFRYLEPRYEGRLDLDLLPNDKVAGRTRHGFSWRHSGALPDAWRWQAEVERVSDDGWWRDFPDARGVLTPRLLPSRVAAEREFSALGGQGLVYARAQHWQVLQGSDSLVTPPFQRDPQLGAQLGSRDPRGNGFEWALQSEINRFTLPDVQGNSGRATGTRWHALATLSRPWREPGGWVVPQLGLNAASYRTDQPMSDGRRSASRLIPTLSVDMGMELERETLAFGRTLRQTLEPRLHYVNTPFREQRGLPNFDAAGKDFNFTSIYADNAYSGIDRVSDSHLLAAGVTTRLLDAASGVEALRLGLVQRYLLRTQRISPNDDGTADGAPLEQKLSDLLLLGSTGVVPNWAFDTALQYSPDIARTKRAIVSARWAPGEFRTLSATYRLTRALSEQMEVGWQWPLRLSSDVASAGAAAPASASSCNRNWYTVGRVNYSMKDRRITDSVVGFEVDSGCWIGRFVAERLSTGRSEATTRLLFQIELVGLSRLGSNPLKVLKDNIPGYRLLRDELRPARDSSPIYD